MKIIIAKQSRLMADFIAAQCVSNFGWSITARVQTVADAIESVAQAKPDILLTGLQFLESDGFHVIEQIRNCGFRGSIAVLTERCDNYAMYRLEKTNVDGYIYTQHTAIEELQLGLSAIAAGEAYFSERYKTSRSHCKRNPISFEKILTDREQEILSMIGSLMTNSEIAERLKVAESTPQKHKFHIMRKLGIRSREELL